MRCLHSNIFAQKNLSQSTRERFFVLEVPTSCHTRTLSVVDDGSFKEVSLICIRILEPIKMLIWIDNGFWIERIYTKHWEPLIGKPTSISFCCITIDSHDFVSEYMFWPLNLLFNCSFGHLSNHSFVINMREFSFDFFDDIGKYSDMREFISTNIGYHTSSCWHLHMIYKCIEEGKTIVEVEWFEEEIRNNSTEKVRITWVIYEVLIYLTNIRISLEENLVISEIVVYLISFLRRYNRFKYGSIWLWMNRLLKCLYREYEIHFWTRNIIRKSWKIDSLYRIKKDEKWEYPLVCTLFFRSECTCEISLIIFESRYFFWEPKISNHHLIKTLCPRISYRIEIEKTSCWSLYNTSSIEFIISVWIEDEISMNFFLFCHM